MILFPAIDLIGGKCVRLRQGRREDCTVYSDDPGAMAKRWEDAGARWLHVVDLEGALDGNFFANEKAIRSIRESVDMKIEMGGGIRSIENVQACLDAGVDRAIVSTAIFEAPDFAEEAFRAFGDRLAVSIDSKDGMVATRGWLASSGVETLEAVRRLHDMGARTLIVTDIAKDGMMAAPNFEMIGKVADERPIQVIASGGVSQIEHLATFAEMKRPNLLGAIIGKALYTGDIDLTEAVRRYPQREGA